VGIPAHAIDFPARIVADEKGCAILPIVAADPGNPRTYIDGQIYGVRPALEETLAPAARFPFSPFHFISLHVFDAFQPEEPPSWYGSIEPILKQAANLYPVMMRILDLGDYESVRQNRTLLLLAFGLDPSDPNYMPVTRDLSKAKRQALLRWLSNDPPLLGKPPVPATGPAAPPSVAQPASTTHEMPAPSVDLLAQGSKALAASKRLGERRYWRGF
jgi:hypothetical protein